MVRSIAGSMCALALLMTAWTAEALEVVTGTVQRVDERRGVVVLEDGRVIRVTPGTRVVVIAAPSERPGGVVTEPPAASIMSGHPAQTPGESANEELQAP
jgi:hypothetical protein